MCVYVYAHAHTHVNTCEEVNTVQTTCDATVVAKGHPRTKPLHDLSHLQRSPNVCEICPAVAESPSCNSSEREVDHQNQKCSMPEVVQGFAGGKSRQSDSSAYQQLQWNLAFINFGVGICWKCTHQEKAHVNVYTVRNEDEADEDSSCWTHRCLRTCVHNCTVMLVHSQACCFCEPACERARTLTQECP